MNITKVFSFVFATLLFVTLHAQAQTQHYFEATVAVRSQNTQERQYAAQRALQKVLIRMAGSRQVLENASIQSAIDKAQNYVEQFQYAENTDQKEVAKGKRQVISLVFSSQAVESLLRNSGEPYWPVNRPKTLVWLVEDRLGDGRQFVNENASPEVVQSFLKAAKVRGLPLIQPLYDLEDRIVLNEEKLWMLDEDSIVQASKRYNADAILVGRFSKTSQEVYLATWQFFHRGENKIYDSRSDDIDMLGASALEPLADFFAAKYAILPQTGETPTLVVQVSGIDGFGGFRQILDYLEGLAIVSDVVLSAVRRDTMLLYLQSDSSLEKFERTLLLDKKLVAEQSDFSLNVPAWQHVPRGTLNNPLLYDWRG